MTTNAQWIGKKGEILACRHLQDKEYTIITTNWRHLQKEVDIIAQKDIFLVFVEVKTRKTEQYGKPHIAVTKAKQNHLIEAADAYCKQNNIDLEVRFDVISIIFNFNQPEIDHIESAFSPQW